MQGRGNVMNSGKNYMYTHIYVHMYIYMLCMYTYIEKERGRLVKTKLFLEGL